MIRVATLIWKDGYDYQTQISLILLLITGLFLLLVFSYVFGRRSFLPIFGFVFAIGYLQGAIELLIDLPMGLGVIKYALLLGGGIFWALRMMDSRRLTKVFHLFRYVPLWLWILFYGLFFWMLARSLFAGEIQYAEIIPIISEWSVLNMLVMLVIFTDIRSLEQVYRFLGILVKLGILAAIIGLIQYLLGPDRLLAIGIDVTKMGHSLLPTEGAQTFRAFSLFPSHYEFAAFMVVSLVAKFVLQMRAGSRLNLVSGLSYLILITGVVVTFNITLWILMIGILFVMMLGLSASVRKGFYSSRMIKTIGRTFLIILVILLLGMLVPAIRFRILGIFEFTSQATAGRSLYWRIIIVRNILGLIREFPLGLGPAIISKIAELQHYRGWFVITSDSFFLWQTLMGGIPLFFCSLLFFVLPLRTAYKIRNQIPKMERPLFWAIWSLVSVGVVLGGLSNSALINGTSTNLLVWASIGVLLKMVEITKLKTIPSGKTSSPPGS